MFRRPHYIALSVVLFIVLIVLSLPNQTAAQLKLALGGFFLPLFGLASSAQSLADRGSSALVPRRVLLDQISSLEAEVQRLRLQVMQSAQVWRECGELREAIGWRRMTAWDLRPAHVTLRETANWWRTIQIDRGLHDGVVTNMPVVSADGLVGKIRQVGYSTSQAVLIGDPDCRVTALVIEDSSGKNPGIPGVISGNSSSVLDPTIVNLTFVDRRSTVKPGQKVLTSGNGGVFPKGILIGQIIDTSSVWYGVYTEARVKLAANLKNLDLVWLVYP